MRTPEQAEPGTRLNAAARGRVAHLELVFSQIASTRMHGVPVLNPMLHVQALGFEVQGEEDAPLLQGILITPWFMNLLRLPLASDAAERVPAPGSKRKHLCGGQLFEFIAGYEDALGGYEACSLFSPMFEFADHAGAVATAAEVLKLLRTPTAAAASAPTGPDATVPSRRGFLLGRLGPGAAP
jgi:[NiFe] hydrogenase assembly HybE family chaperone